MRRNLETETIFANVFGSKVEVVRGSSYGYADYLAGYAKAENKLEFNATYFKEQSNAQISHLSPQHIRRGA